MSRPVVWALVPDLGRTGVPVTLERLVRWQAAHEPDAAEVHVISGRDGALRSAFAVSAASLTALEPAEGRAPATTVAVGLAQLGQAGAGERIRAAAARRHVRRLPAPDVVLVQGAGAWRTFTALEHAVGGARVVLHLHELDIAVSRSGLGADPRQVVRRADLVLAVSEPVADLVRRHGAGTAAVAIVPGSVDAPPAGWHAPIRVAPTSDVVSIGAAGWRKGTDLATAAAHELGRTDPAVRWHWVGEPEPSAWALAVGAADPLVRHGATVAPWTAVPAPAALVVPSREDPLPLVALEAGARGVPVIGASTGGLPDLLAEHRGLLVDPTDTESLAEAVRTGLADPSAAAERARRLRDHVRQHHTAEVVGPRWLAALLAP